MPFIPYFASLVEFSQHHLLPHHCQQIPHPKEKRRISSVIIQAWAGQLVCAACGRPPVCHAASPPSAPNLTVSVTSCSHRRTLAHPHHHKVCQHLHVGSCLVSALLSLVFYYFYCCVSDLLYCLLWLRYGSTTILMADDGDGDLYNASLLLLEGRQLLEVDKQEGVRVGGAPHFQDTGVLKIHSDYFDGETLAWLVCCSVRQSDGNEGNTTNRFISPLIQVAWTTCVLRTIPCLCHQ